MQLLLNFQVSRQIKSDTRRYIHYLRSILRPTALRTWYSLRIVSIQTTVQVYERPTTYRPNSRTEGMLICIESLSDNKSDSRETDKHTTRVIEYK